MRTLILSLPLLSVGIAVAQTLTPATPRVPSTPIVVAPPVPGLPVAPPLTTQAVANITQRFDAYFALQRATAPSAAALRAAGLSGENDVVEQATLKPALPVGVANVGRLTRPSTAGTKAEDPGVADVARTTLRSRLGRDPSRAELDAELRAFDARIGAVNQSLVTLRPQIAAALKSDGAFPRAIEATALGVAPAAVDANAAQASEGVRALVQPLLAR
jgi:hypothetical protein